MGSVSTIIFLSLILNVYVLINGQGIPTRSLYQDFSKRQEFPKRNHQIYQSYNQLRAQPFRDGWYNWGSWSMCTKSCGVGVQVQTRNCAYTPYYRKRLNTRGNNTPYSQLLQNPRPLPPLCKGANKKIRICNIQTCADGTNNSRASLCNSLSNQQLYTQQQTQYSWKPWDKGGQLCRLTCKAVEQAVFYQGKEVVADGTECHITDRYTSSNKAVCFQGHCLTLGCDGVVGSQKIVDSCGVCGGKNSTCQLIEERYRKQYDEIGYHDIVIIPSGTKNINIFEMSTSQNYLAIKSLDGNYYFNGNLRQGLPDPTDTYNISGVPFEYVRPFQSEKGEVITSDGPTTIPLQLVIYHQTRNPGIHYSFVKPKTEQRKPIFKSKLPGLTKLTDEVIRENIQPYHNDIVIRNQDGVTSTADFYKSKPATEQRLKDGKKSKYVQDVKDNFKKQVTVWKDMGYGVCSKNCAAGVQVSTVKCVHNRTLEVVADSFCKRLYKQKPRLKVCNRKACEPYYSAGPWSSCSRSCGVGRRTRSVVCKQEFPGNFITTVSHRKCREAVRPETHEKCQVQDCAKWKFITEWSQCSVACGSGKQYKNVACVAGDGTHIPEKFCQPSHRPQTIRTCHAGPCITRWFTTDWEECTKMDCNKAGFQRRNVYCVNTANRVSGCRKNYKPHSTRNCTSDYDEIAGSCEVKYEWLSSQWSKCSVDCGKGYQQRIVSCMKVFANQTVELVSEDGNTCDLSTKPTTSQDCHIANCGAKWHFTKWSTCSKSCGEGRHVRLVQCLDNEGRISENCEESLKPPAQQACTVTSCELILHSTCVDKVANRCHLIFKSRLCSYPVYYKERCCKACSQSNQNKMKAKIRRYKSNILTKRSQQKKSRKS